MRRKRERMFVCEREPSSKVREEDYVYLFTYCFKFKFYLPPSLPPPISYMISVSLVVIMLLLLTQYFKDKWLPCTSGRFH